MSILVPFIKVHNSVSCLSKRTLHLFGEWDQPTEKCGDCQSWGKVGRRLLRWGWEDKWRRNPFPFRYQGVVRLASRNSSCCTLQFSSWPLHLRSKRKGVREAVVFFMECTFILAVTKYLEIVVLSDRIAQSSLMKSYLVSRHSVSYWMNTDFNTLFNTFFIMFHLDLIWLSLQLIGSALLTLWDVYQTH